MFNKKRIVKSLILFLAAGTYASNDIVYAGQNVTVSTNVTGQVYGNNDGDCTIRSNTADTSGNTVTVEDGANISGSVYGTDSDNTINENNKVIINGGNITGDVNAAHGYNSQSNNNSVIINGGTIDGWVHAAYDAAEKTNNNTVTINNGTINSSVFTACGRTSNNNTVTVNDGLVKDNVYGGGWRSNEASNNKVIINGGHIKGSVYASYFTPKVNNNSVDWYGGIIDGSILGTDSLNENINTTFNFYASSANSNKNIAGLGNFKNYHFYIDNTVMPGSTLIKVNNTVDLRNSNIGVAMTSGAALNIGDNINLLETQELKTDENLVNNPTNMDGYAGNLRSSNIYDVYDFSLYNTGTNLMAYVGDVVPNSQNEDIPASRQPEVALIDDKLDIVDTAYQMSIGKSEPVIYYDFNYTDVKKGDLTLRGSDNVIGSALTKGDEEKKNTITQGPFIEYGDGSFGGKNFYSTGGVEGSGKNKKYGAGYLFRQVKFGKHHFDAYVRAGKINNEFRSFMQGVGNVDYDNSDVYYAAHFGYGKYMPIDPHTTMDVYGKYFYKILPGSSTTTHVSTGGDINTEFDALTSHKFRIGSKITWDYMEEKKKMMFADLALEHELSHTQTSRLGDRVISNSSGADTTAVMEVGYRQVFGPKDAFLFTADLQGYAGTRTGFGGNIGVRFNF